MEMNYRGIISAFSRTLSKPRKELVGFIDVSIDNFVILANNKLRLGEAVLMIKSELFDNTGLTSESRFSGLDIGVEGRNGSTSINTVNKSSLGFCGIRSLLIFGGNFRKVLAL